MGMVLCVEHQGFASGQGGYGDDVEGVLGLDEDGYEIDFVVLVGDQRGFTAPFRREAEAYLDFVVVAAAAGGGHFDLDSDHPVAVIED